MTGLVRLCESYEPRHEISNNVVCTTSKGSDQSDQSLCQLLEYSMSVKLLTEHNLEFICLREGCTDSSDSTLVKMPRCWKSHVKAQCLMTTFHFRVFIYWYHTRSLYNAIWNYIRYAKCVSSNSSTHSWSQMWELFPDQSSVLFGFFEISTFYFG